MDASSISCCFLAFVLYYNSLDAGFVYDDSRAILSNPDVLPTTPISDLWHNDFWGTPLTNSGSHGSYRPLCVFSFRLNHWACGFRPWGYHLVNVLLHLLSTSLVVRVAKIVLPSSGPTMAGLIFAAHPIHTEAVSGIVGRADMLAGLQDLPPCFMSCFSIQQWACLFTSVIMAAAAMLSKETGVTVLAVCAVYDVIRSRRVPVKTLRLATSLCVLGLSLVCLMLLRIHIMGPNTPAFASSDNPTARSPSFLVRTITFLYLPIFNMQLLICPKVLSFDWSMDAIPRITSVFDPRVPLTIVVYYLTYRSVRHALVGVFSKSIRREGEKQPCYRRTLARTTQQYNNFRNANVNNNNNNNNNSIVHIKFASKVCLSCRHSVSDNHSQQCRIVNNNNHTVKCECHIVRTNRSAEKSEIFLISLSLLVIPFLPATNLLFYVGFVVAERVLYIPSVGYSFLLAYGCHLLSKRTSKRGVRVCLALLLAVFTARTLQRNKDWMDEESLYRSGIPVNPPKAYGNLGSVLSTQGRMAEAEQAYRMALKYRPNMADVHYNLGILLQGREEYDEAIVSYQLAIQCRPSLALAHLNLGQLLASRGRCEEAEAVLRRCSQLDGTGLKDPRTHENTRISALLHLGRLHADRGKYQEAVNVYKEAIQAMPQHYQPQILYNLLGEALSRLHMHDEAEHWYKAALLAKPDHVPAHLTYGKLLAKNRTRLVEAEQWFLRAQKLAPSDPMVYQHFGQFLSELERYNEAATQYLKAVKLAPKQYEVVLGAATALRQAGRKTEAEAFYREAVKLRPDDSGSHSNLGAMLHLNGKFTEAAASYREALRLQPHDVTTINNLHKLHNLMARVRT